MMSKNASILEQSYSPEIKVLLITNILDRKSFPSQIYRGPSVGKGYDVFAPWGYYDTQPADFHKKKYH